MLNKELLMMGGAEGLWTLQCVFTGEPSVGLILYGPTGEMLWDGNPITDILEFQVPAKSTLRLWGDFSKWYPTREQGCTTFQIDARHIEITLHQSSAYLELDFPF